MALADDAARLARIPLFGGVEPDALRLLAFACETRILLADMILFRAGSTSLGGYLILSGGFRLVDVDDRIMASGPGALLAETALLRDVGHDQTATATDTATVLKIPRAAVLRVLEEHPGSAQRVLAFYAQRLHGALLEFDGLKAQASR